MATERLGTGIRQEQIVEAVLSLLASQGIAELSIAGVARRVGLVPSAIYRHFKSKEEMLDAAIEHIGDRLAANVATVRAGIKDPVDRLHRLLILHVRLIRSNRGILHILFSESVYDGRADRKTKLYDVIRAYLNGVAGIIREGQEEGRIHKELDPATASVMFLGLIQPAAMLWHMSDGEFDVTRHAERGWKVFSAAIQGKHQ